MTQSTSKTPIIVCCDSLQEQARLSGLLSKDYDNIMGCQIGTTRNVNATRTVSKRCGWMAATNRGTAFDRRFLPQKIGTASYRLKATIIQ